MPQLQSFLQELLVLYGMAAVGYWAKSRQLFDQTTDQALTQLVLYITLPALILFSMDFPFSRTLLYHSGWLLLLSCYTLGIACLLARVITTRTKAAPERAGVQEGLMVFGNQGFLGYAVCYSLLAEEGILLAALFNIPFLLLIWTYGVYLLAREKQTFSWRLVFFNPGIAATLWGLILLFLPWHWPEPLSRVLQLLGTPTTPLALILLGSLLANLKLNSLSLLCRQPQIWLAMGVKLLLVPLALFPFIPFSINPEVLFVAVLLSGMPSAPTVPLFAQKYGGDALYASVGVFLSTLFALITLPLLLWLSQLFLPWGLA